MQRVEPADAVRDEAGGKPAQHAEAQHEREHLGPARRAIAQVGAIGDDMDLRHRHGDTAGEPRQHQRGEQQRMLGQQALLPAAARWRGSPCHRNAGGA